MKAVIVGLIAASVIVAFMQLVFFPILDLFITFPETPNDMYDSIRESTGFYVLMLALGWIIGGLYEEIVFHGYIFAEFNRLFSGKYAAIVSFLLTGILFGLYHLQLGPADTLNALFVGMAYHGIYLYYKGNLWYSIFTHGFYNTIVITLLYLGII